VLVDFWAAWCGPCRAVAPAVEEIAKEYAGKLKVVKVDVDENGEVAARYGITSIPTLMVFKGGKMVERLRSFEKELGDLRQRVAGSEVDHLLKGAADVGGIMVVAARVAAPDLEVLKHLADRLGERLGDGVVCLGAVVEGRAAIVVSVGAGLVKSRGLSASPVAKKLGELVGGRGGGKATFAQAGGKSVEMLDDALGRCQEVIADLAK